MNARPFGGDHLHDLGRLRLSCWRSILIIRGIGDDHGGPDYREFSATRYISDRGKEAVQAFWEYAASERSLVFLLIGMRVAHQDFGAIWIPAGIAIAFVTLGRAVAIYPLCLSFSMSSLRVAMKHQHVLFWGGLRGPLALPLPWPSG